MCCYCCCCCCYYCYSYYYSSASYDSHLMYHHRFVWRTSIVRHCRVGYVVWDRIRAFAEQVLWIWHNLIRNDSLRRYVDRPVRPYQRQESLAVCVCPALGTRRNVPNGCFSPVNAAYPSFFVLSRHPRVIRKVFKESFGLRALFENVCRRHAEYFDDFHHLIKLEGSKSVDMDSEHRARSSLRFSRRTMQR